MDISYLDGWNAKHFVRNDGESLICDRHHISYEVLCYELWLKALLHGAIFHATCLAMFKKKILIMHCRRCYTLQ
jgi:hypothetical protein